MLVEDTKKTERSRRLSNHHLFCPRNQTFMAPILVMIFFVWTSHLMGQDHRVVPKEPWMDFAPKSTGIAVGKKIPSFRLRDQAGRVQDFDSIRGPKGAAIYFVRSADW